MKPLFILFYSAIFIGIVAFWSAVGTVAYHFIMIKGMG